MKKTIKLSENDLHSIITESVKRVLNELDSQTYYNAGKKAYQLGQYDRSNNFKNYGNEVSKKEIETANNELETNDNRFNFKITSDGFKTVIDKNDEIHLLAAYDVNSDKLYVNDGYGYKEIRPGHNVMRSNNRSLINKILQYFAKYKPDSKYNNKNYWIA